MRDFLRVALLAASVFAASASATSGSNNNCKQNSSEPCGNQNATTNERMYDIPKLATRTEKLEQRTAIDGVSFDFVPYGATSWTLSAKNDTDDSISILWDESSFVTSAGESAGKLIRGETRKIDVEKQQPPTPVAPHAHLTQTILVEKLLDEEDHEEKIANFIRSSVLAPKKDIDAITSHRQQVAKSIVGGKLYVVVSTSAGKHTWAGEVSGGQ